MRSQNFPCIDGLRAFAAVSVVLCHTVGVSNLVSTTSGAYLAALRAGVEVFFVISGFVLYRPFAKAHRRKKRGPSLGGYFRRRFLRIFPAYWLVLTIGFAFGVTFLAGIASTVSNYLLVQTYVHQPSFVVGLDPAWTLVVEVTFYVFLPFYAAAVWWIGQRNVLATEFIGCTVLLGIGVSCAVWTAYGAEPRFVQVLPANLAPFALGMALAVIKENVSSESRAGLVLDRAFARPPIPWLAALLAFSATVWAIQYPAVLQFVLPPATTQIAYALLTYAMGLLIVIPVVFGNQSRGAGRRMLQSRAVVLLGAISYGIYLWHVPVIDEILGTPLFGYRGSGPPRENFTITAITLVFTALVAAVSWYFLEKPLIQFSRDPGRYIRSRSGTRALHEVVTPDASAVAISSPMVDAIPCVVTRSPQKEVVSAVHGGESAQDWERAPDSTLRAAPPEDPGANVNDRSTPRPWIRPSDVAPHPGSENSSSGRQRVKDPCVRWRLLTRGITGSIAGIVPENR